jgi:hypothetical protein
MLPQTTQRVSTLSDPPRGIVDPVVLDTNYDPCLRGFTVTGAGDVKVTYDDGSIGVLPARQAGVDYGGMIYRIWSVGTTATGIKGYV